MKCLIFIAVLGGSSLASAAELTGTGAMTSDYVWRGTSQTQGNPALQAGLRVTGSSGMYASAWSSDVEFAAAADAHTEVDLTFGWTRELSREWKLDLNVVRYHYPSASADLGWTEANGTLGWADHAWLSLGWSPEALASRHAGLYAQLGGRLPLSPRLSLEGAVARYFLHERDYRHVQVGAVVALGETLALRVTAHHTDDAAKALLGDDVAGARLEAALQASF